MKSTGKSSIPDAGGRKTRGRERTEEKLKKIRVIRAVTLK
jgi:hypothetical protein